MAPRVLALFGALAGPLALLHAQAPLSMHLATQDPFQFSHYYSAPGQNNTATPPIPQNLPATYRGFLCLLDLTANADVTVSQIDFSVVDDGHYKYNWGPMPGQSGGPGLLGQTAVVKVYTTPTSWVGLSQTPAAWTQISTGTLTVGAYNQRSPAVFPTPFVLPTGTYGLAFEVGPVTAAVPGITYASPPYALHPYLLVSSFLPGAPTTARDQFLRFEREDIVSQAFVNAPGPQPKNPIFDLHYTVAGNSAHATRYGTGCYDRPRAFYEVFPAMSPSFDLSQQAIRMVPTGDRYVVSSANAPVVAPTTPGLMNAGGQPMGDNDRTAALPLGFTFNYPGGSTTSIAICSDGFLLLDTANMGNQNQSVTVKGFLMGQPQLALFNTDLDPRVGGSIHLDLDPVAQAAYVTWQNVPSWDLPGITNTFQAVLFANGNIEYRYGACGPSKEETLVGFTPGWSSHDPGMTDITGAMPFVTGDGVLPPDLAMQERPILGSSVSMFVRDMPQASAGGMFFGGPRPPLDLGAIGLPGCLQQVDPMSFVFFGATGTTGSVALSFPNTPGYVGMQVTCQALVLSAGSNVAGMTVSNPLSLDLGW